MVVAKRRSVDAFSAAYQDAVKAANDAAAKAAGFDNEENRKTLGDKFDEQHKALNAAAMAKLQALVDQIYANGRYADDLTYSEALRPALSAEDAKWAEQLMANDPN